MSTCNTKDKRRIVCVLFVAFVVWIIIGRNNSCLSGRVSPFVRSENKLQGHIENNWLIWPLFPFKVSTYFFLFPSQSLFSHTVRLIVACFLQLATCIWASFCLSLSLSLSLCVCAARLLLLLLLPLRSFDWFIVVREATGFTETTHCRQLYCFRHETKNTQLNCCESCGCLFNA